MDNYLSFIYTFKALRNHETFLTVVSEEKNKKSINEI